MAKKMTKAQARKRLEEAQKKIWLVSTHPHWGVMTIKEYQEMIKLLTKWTNKLK